MFIKSGVKMTGMPAFGPSYPDSVLWDITALVKRLPSLTPGQYRDLTQGLGMQVLERSDKGVVNHGPDSLPARQSSGWPPS